MNLSEIKVIIKSGGDIASGVAWRLHRCGLRVFITEIAQPMAIRRKVAFSEAVYEHEAVVEGVKSRLIHEADNVEDIWGDRHIPVMVDPDCEVRHVLKPQVIVDAILGKRNTGTSIEDASLVIALGPGFEVGKDAHYVVETNRGHNLGRLLTEGSAEPDTGVPGSIQGFTSERVLRAPADGLWKNILKIGDLVKKGDIIGSVNDIEVIATIDGVIRGMIRPGIQVHSGLKIGDIDPRGIEPYCYSISEKALAIAGGVLEGILSTF